MWAFSMYKFIKILYGNIKLIQTCGKKLINNPNATRILNNTLIVSLSELSDMHISGSTSPIEYVILTAFLKIMTRDE
jgi:hypothetical protein